MSTRVISDLHLAPHTAERNSRFLMFLQDALQAKDEVIIAGDLFDLWFGWEHLTFDYQKEILKQMKELASQGLRMTYLEGNRDYGIWKHGNSIFETVWQLNYKTKIGNCSVFIEHGDLVNTRDRQYRFWRRLSKNNFVFFLLDHLPGPLLLGIASGLERKLRGTNMKYKAQYPEEECTARAVQEFQEGNDVVIFGHFHEERFVERTFDGRTVLFYNLPGWEQGFRYLVIPATGEKPYFKEFTKDNGNSTAA